MARPNFSQPAGSPVAPRSQEAEVAIALPPFNVLKASLAVFLLYMVLTSISAAALALIGNVLHPYTRVSIFAVTVAAVGYRHLRRCRQYPAVRYLVWTLVLVMLYLSCMATAVFLRDADQSAATFAGSMLLQTAIFILAGLLAFGVAERIFRVSGGQG